MTLPAQDIVERREWLIRKDGYFYRPNCQGYTTRKIEAGRYTKAKAEAEAAVEPWHMSAVHQDDIPDEPAVADLNATISRLTADNEALRSALEAERAAMDVTQRRAIAAEARADALAQKVGRAEQNYVDANEAHLDCIRTLERIADARMPGQARRLAVEQLRLSKAIVAALGDRP